MQLPFLVLMLWCELLRSGRSKKPQSCHEGHLSHLSGPPGVARFLPPPRDVVQKAAAMCAFYSQAKTQKSVAGIEEVGQWL